jgi:hypothetical protein
MTLRGTSTRFAVWEDMAIEERLSWVRVPGASVRDNDREATRSRGGLSRRWPVVDQVGEMHDAT